VRTADEVVSKLRDLLSKASILETEGRIAEALSYYREAQSFAAAEGEISQNTAQLISNLELKQPGVQPAD
jgi:hypothetical protein